MGTTTKMAIPYPEATGLVKDGWEDMKDIANQVDAKSGLVLINTTTFSGVSSQSINDVFSANYDNYKIVFNSNHSSTINSINMRYRVAGSDASGANYERQGLVANNATVSGFRATGVTSAEVATIYATKNLAIVEVGNPFAAIPTTTSCYWQDEETGVFRMLFFVTRHSLSTSYTGFTFFPTNNTMTGSVSVFGYNK